MNIASQSFHVYSSINLGSHVSDSIFEERDRRDKHFFSSFKNGVHFVCAFLCRRVELFAHQFVRLKEKEKETYRFPLSSRFLLSNHFTIQIQFNIFLSFSPRGPNCDPSILT